MLNRFFGDLKIVLIESPYDTLQLQSTQALFSQCAALKIESYRGVYPYGVLPVDGYDFVATHHLLCRQRKEALEILMGYKSVTLAKCRAHGLVFPALGLLQNSGAKEHAQVLTNHLEKHDRHPEKVSYGGSWTARPDARENPVLKPVLKEIFIANLVHYEDSIGTTERYCYGVMKVKTDRFFREYGYSPLSGRNGTLPPFLSSSLLGEQSLMLRCQEFSDEARRLAEKYRALWDARLHIDSDFVERELAGVERKVAA